MTDHEYTPRSDGFRTQGVIGGQLVEGVPCIICAQFQMSHTPVPEPAPERVKEAAESLAARDEAPKKKVAAEPARKPATKKSTAKKSTAKKTTAKRSKK